MTSRSFRLEFISAHPAGDILEGATGSVVRADPETGEPSRRALLGIAVATLRRAPESVDVALEHDWDRGWVFVHGRWVATFLFERA